LDRVGAHAAVQGEVARRPSLVRAAPESEAIRRRVPSVCMARLVGLRNRGVGRHRPAHVASGLLGPRAAAEACPTAAESSLAPRRCSAQATRRPSSLPRFPKRSAVTATCTKSELPASRRAIPIGPVALSTTPARSRKPIFWGTSP
jgi:hypothetical protein